LTTSLYPLSTASLNIEGPRNLPSFLLLCTCLLWTFWTSKFISLDWTSYLKYRFELFNVWLQCVS
jgi:hypothetical protein